MGVQKLEYLGIRYTHLYFSVKKGKQCYLKLVFLEAFIGQSFLFLLLFSLLEVDDIQAFPLANLAHTKEKGHTYFSVSLVKVVV